MFRFLLVLVIFGFIGCTKPEPQVTRYYDLDSLLSAQVVLLTENQYGLTKTTFINGEEETKTATPDSAQWAEELSVFAEFSLNDRAFDAFDVKQSESMISYILRESVKSTVKEFTISEKGGITIIQAKSQSDNPIYSDTKKQKLVLEDGVLKNYQLDGSQKMRLKDSVSYSIVGKISKP